MPHFQELFNEKVFLFLETNVYLIFFGKIKKIKLRKKEKKYKYKFKFINCNYVQLNKRRLDCVKNRKRRKKTAIS